MQGQLRGQPPRAQAGFRDRGGDGKGSGPLSHSPEMSGDGLMWAHATDCFHNIASPTDSKAGVPNEFKVAAS